MDPQAAKLLGAGLAAIGIGLAALGVGNVFAAFLQAALRNPSAADSQHGRLSLGFAAAALPGLPAFLVAAIPLFAASSTTRPSPPAAAPSLTSHTPPRPNPP